MASWRSWTRSAAPGPVHEVVGAPAQDAPRVRGGPPDRQTVDHLAGPVVDELDGVDSVDLHPDLADDQGVAAEDAAGRDRLAYRLWLIER